MTSDLNTTNRGESVTVWYWGVSGFNPPARSLLQPLGDWCWFMARYQGLDLCQSCTRQGSRVQDPDTVAVFFFFWVASKLYYTILLCHFILLHLFIPLQLFEQATVFWPQRVFSWLYNYNSSHGTMLIIRFTVRPVRFSTGSPPAAQHTDCWFQPTGAGSP